MARLQITAPSMVMNEDVRLDVCLPTLTCGMRREPREFYKEYTPCPVLWLLHGTYGDHSDWFRYTSVERYADEAGIAVVTMSGRLSSYTDMAYGPRYATFITEELPELLWGMLPLSSKREDNWIGGLSMGGYGALKLGIRRSDRFGGILALSAGIDRAGNAEKLLAEPREGVHGLSMYRDVFGDDLTKVRGSENDLFAVAEKTVQKNMPMPLIYQAVGTEDWLYPDNVRFCDHLKKLGYSVIWEQGPGAHEWDFWDTYVRKGIRVLSQALREKS